jgi:hypothetical protein
MYEDASAQYAYILRIDDMYTKDKRDASKSQPTIHDLWKKGLSEEPIKQATKKRVPFNRRWAKWPKFGITKMDRAKAFESARRFNYRLNLAHKTGKKGTSNLY